MIFLDKNNEKLRQKIRDLEQINQVLYIFTNVVGVITIIDLIVPDPLFGIDEVALASLTTLLGLITALINRNIERLKKEGKFTLKISDINDIGREVKNTKENISKSRSKSSIKKK